MAHILTPKRNCWRKAHADCAAWLIDGEAYFSAVREAIIQARHSILILGWDIDSRITLLPGKADDGLPGQLGDFLNHVVEQHKTLHAHILIWDFSMIYSPEREWMPIYKLGWKTHRRLHFHMDDKHPVGASQHQKVIVIDDQVAFVGGFDLSKWRWDSSEHRADDSRRIDPDHNPYPPFHDIQMIVSGPVAAELGRLARKRWLVATGEELPPISEQTALPWPPSVEPALRNIEVAISRTQPEYDGCREVREIERLYLDAIGSARHWIYIENQYFTSQRIHEVFCESLERKQGPELVMVLPQHTGGWLEQHTMDVLRDRLLRQLKERDKHQRLRIYYAALQGTQSQFVQIHSKVMVIDDRLLTIGSANLSNRSMGLDSECNLALESNDVEQKKSIISFRQRLLAEHLGCKERDFDATMSSEGSLIAEVERLRGGERTLVPLEPVTPDDVDSLVPEQPLLDPERPIEADRMINLLVETEEQKPAGGRMLIAGILLGVLLLLATLWRWTPLSDWLAPANLQAMFENLAALPAAPLIIIGSIILASLLMVPVTLLVVVAILTFGPLEGLFYGHLGATLSSLLAFAIGHLLGRQTIRQLAGNWLNRLSRRLGERGILSVIFLRIVPVAPFTVVNLVAGASHISFRDFLVGTIIGLLPGIAALSAFVDGLLRTLRDPQWDTALWLVAIIGIIALGGYLLHKGFSHQRTLKQ